jgi:hypothetical protein
MCRRDRLHLQRVGNAEENHCGSILTLFVLTPQLKCRRRALFRLGWRRIRVKPAP